MSITATQPTADAPAAPQTQKRLLTGLRPTGKFHLGNYVGTFEKDVELQNSGDYECFFLVADYHALTTGFETRRAASATTSAKACSTSSPSASTRSKSTLYLQSLIPEVVGAVPAVHDAASVPRARSASRRSRSRSAT